MIELLKIFVFGPSLYTLLSNGGVFYNANIFEKIGSLTFTLTNIFYNILIVVSPIYFPYFLIRYKFLSIFEGLKIYFLIYFAALFLRFFGRIIK